MLPDQSSGPSHLAIAGDKAGTVYLVNQDNLGHFNSVGGVIVQERPTQFFGGLYSTPAYFNNRIYFGPSGGALVSFALSTSRSRISRDSLKYWGIGGLNGGAGRIRTLGRLRKPLGSYLITSISRYRQFEFTSL
jgi:hypothetical protein